MHSYQHRGVQHILDNPAAGLFLEMGLGKTVTTLTALNILIYEELDVTRALVIAPKRVAESVWPAEVRGWEHLQHLRVSKVIGKPVNRLEALKADADIFVIGRDNVAWLCGLYGGSKLPFDCLVIDELSSFKNPKSIRFKALRGVRSSFKRVIGLTGTPSPNGLIDLWAQIYLLDQGQRLGKFISNYRDNFFKPGKRNGAIIYSYNVQEDGKERIYKKIGDICMSMKAKDYLDLPERINRYIRIPMPPDLKKKYEEFEREQVLRLFPDGIEDGVEISALNAAALSNKLLQFANGAIYDEKKDFHVVHDLKMEVLEEILENLNGSPLLLAWTFRSDMYRIKERFAKYSPRELKTEQDILDWNKGQIQLLMMHPASGGHGLNLQTGGHNILWFGNTWSLELEQQFNARLDRQGQTKSVIVNKLVMEGTMDVEVIASQEGKATGQDALMEAVKAKILKYAKRT